MLHTFEQQIKDILKNYETLTFIQEKALESLMQVEPAEKFKLLMKSFQRDSYSMNGVISFSTHHAHDFKGTIHFLEKVFSLLNADEKEQLFKENLRNVFFSLTIELLDGNGRLSQQEKSEILNQIAQFMQNNLNVKTVKEFFDRKTLLGESLYDFAKKTGNPDLISTIYESMYHKPYCKRHPIRLFKECVHSFHEFNFTSKSLRTPMFDSSMMHLAYEKGQKILESLIEGCPPNERWDEENRLYTLRCLNSRNGLCALGAGLLDFAEAKAYAKNKTLEPSLANASFPYFKLFSQAERLLLKGCQLLEIQGDYAFFCLENGIVTPQQLSSLVEYYEFSALRSVFTYHGVIALQEKLITLEDAICLYKKDKPFPHTLTVLFSPSGIAAMREGFLERNKISSIKNSDQLILMLNAYSKTKHVGFNLNN